MYDTGSEYSQSQTEYLRVHAETTGRTVYYAGWFDSLIVNNWSYRFSYISKLTANH